MHSSQLFPKAFPGRFFLFCQVGKPSYLPSGISLGFHWRFCLYSKLESHKFFLQDLPWKIMYYQVGNHHVFPQVFPWEIISVLSGWEPSCFTFPRCYFFCTFRQGLSCSFRAFPFGVYISLLCILWFGEHSCFLLAFPWRSMLLVLFNLPQLFFSTPLKFPSTVFLHSLISTLQRHQLV